MALGNMDRVTLGIAGIAAIFSESGIDQDPPPAIRTKMIEITVAKKAFIGHPGASDQALATAALKAIASTDRREQILGSLAAGVLVSMDKAFAIKHAGKLIRLISQINESQAGPPTDKEINDILLWATNDMVSTLNGGGIEEKHETTMIQRLSAWAILSRAQHEDATIDRKLAEEASALLLNHGYSVNDYSSVDEIGTDILTALASTDLTARLVASLIISAQSVSGAWHDKTTEAQATSVLVNLQATNPRALDTDAINKMLGSLIK